MVLNRKIAAAAAVGVLAFLPVLSRALTVEEVNAQIQALLQQVASLQKQLAELRAASQTQAAPAPLLQERPLVCSMLSRDLAIGMEGADVRAVQSMLAKDKDVYPEGLVTGYFGSLTQEALKRLRIKLVIAGYGAANPPAGEDGKLGPWLRPMVLSYWCDAAPQAPAPIPAAPVMPPPPPAPAFSCPTTVSATPTELCAGGWVPLYQNGTCHTGWRCAAPLGTSGIPVIDSFTGPTELVVGETGTWTVEAHDPDGGSLFYNVRWNDEGFEELLRQFAGLETVPFTQSSTFTHAYGKESTYPVTLTVRDSAGHETGATVSVRVRAAAASNTCTSNYSPVCGSVPIQCITTPCTPIPQTFTNRCYHDEAGATFLYAGTCVAGGLQSQPSTGFAPPSTAVPSGMTYCATPLGNRLIASGGTVSLSQYFATSTNALPNALAKCMSGRWFQCDSQGNNCSLRHVLPHNPTSGLPGYGNTAGSSCTAGRQTEVMAPPNTLLCRRLNCAMTQEDTRVRLSCTQENGWTEVLQ